MARKAKRDLTMEEQLARGPLDLPFLMLVLMLITQAQAWAGGGVRETFAYQALYGQEEAVSKK